MGATRGLPYIYLIQKITQNYLWQRGKGLNQIVCNFDSTFAVRLWQNQLENSVTKRSCIRHQLDCLNKKSQTLWCDTTCNRKRHFLSHQNFNGIYKISRESSVRETYYVKCNRMRARARRPCGWTQCHWGGLRLRGGVDAVDAASLMKVQAVDVCGNDGGDAGLGVPSNLGF